MSRGIRVQRPIVSAEFYSAYDGGHRLVKGATLTLDCGHEVVRLGTRYVDRCHSITITKAVCDTCSKKETNR